MPYTLGIFVSPASGFELTLFCFIFPETKLKEYPVEEKEVLKILTQVNVTRRQCEIVRTDKIITFLFLIAKTLRGIGCDIFLFFFVETGVNRLWGEKGDQQKEANDFRRESKYWFKKSKDWFRDILKHWWDKSKTWFMVMEFS